jgi:hypothetical protein
MAGQIPLGGMKISEEMAFVELTTEAPPWGIEVDVMQALAARHIALFYLTMSYSESHSRVCFCMLPDQTALVAQLARTIGRGALACRTITAVGLLTVFPHNRCVDALTRSLDIFAKSELPVYGVASTLSTLTFVLALGHLEQATEQLREVFQLPNHHPPFEPEFRVKPMLRSS